MQHFERGGLRLGAFLVVGQRARAMDHPDVALPVDGDAADLAEDPVAGKRFRPGRIDREGQDLAGSRAEAYGRNQGSEAGGEGQAGQR